MGHGGGTDPHRIHNSHTRPMKFKQFISTAAAFAAAPVVLATSIAAVAVAIEPAPKAQAATCYGIGMNTAMPMVRCY